VPATLRSLLADSRFNMELVAGLSSEAALDLPIAWVHSSDLPDPTPWLEPAQLLLTNGAQFGRRTPQGFTTRYVERLVEADIRALGFATEVVYPEIPATLVQACGEYSLPLVRVADRTPFIAIIRHVADVIAREQRERLEWSMRAQRALARAALRPDGLPAVLHELERQLNCWVAMYDAVGDRVPVPTKVPIPKEVEAALKESVRSVLAKGMRAGVRLGATEGDVTLQTLGQRDQLRGVLAVGTAAPLDPAGSDLVASVIALASIAVEQSRTLDAARRDLRSGLLELMLSGSTTVAAATAERVWGGLPHEPLAVALFSARPDSEPALQELELRAGRQHGRLFFAQRGEGVAVIASVSDTDAVARLLARHDLAVGISGPGGWAELQRLLAEAERARNRTATDRRVVLFEEMHGEGMLGLINRQGAGELAARMLAPLQDAPEGQMLKDSARTWMEHNCAWDPAARALGVHRHTLRNRIRTVEDLLDLDLETFSGRMELWTALQFVD
jgi:purine catabolism regulator